MCNCKGLFCDDSGSVGGVFLNLEGEEMKSVSKRRAENGIRRKITRRRFEDWEVRLVCMLVDVVNAK
ncbi:hypothetical protein HanXRQr2_Chr04g0177311 [Helianthus annuus]|uniref:Uncharacterized protein n=1 Tax=Helianthus annuus TaxID=4232 RepID=A0A9K3J9Y6_HELAN|nr:hypothetical protein HanXRQr2_Chr04g0177311 [Helianthus annuus]KAJ0932215.1 hypothetical protein HanPSC8_Chr04g0171091 [Helianthus annuus]